MSELDSERVRDYFTRRETVAGWWTPDEGPLAFHYDAELRVLDEQLDVSPDWEVLDVGTGRGRVGVHFAERGCRVLGIDLNPHMLELAREVARRRGVEDRFEVQQGAWAASGGSWAPLRRRRSSTGCCPSTRRSSVGASCGV